MIVLLLLYSLAFGGIEDMFGQKVDVALEEAFRAWMVKDEEGMRRATSKLVQYETYLFVLTHRTRYLSDLPRSLRPEHMVPYLFLLKKRREGVDLMPPGLFRGRRFMYKLKGGKHGNL
ncbi:MAG: hypothetical protein DRN28_07180 [Thermoplasmata archaeon]|nr:MAG: hypothetical protein DRN28_07180 [Thermoplasmata archaeon]